VNPLLTPTELGYFCVGFIFWLGALIHVSFYLCIDLSLFLILRVLSLVGQLAFTDMGTSTTTTTPSPTWVRPPHPPRLHRHGYVRHNHHAFTDMGTSTTVLLWIWIEGHPCLLQARHAAVDRYRAQQQTHRTPRRRTGQTDGRTPCR